jgi:hypothetical protein
MNQDSEKGELDLGFWILDLGFWDGLRSSVEKIIMVQHPERPRFSILWRQKFQRSESDSIFPASDGMGWDGMGLLTTSDRMYALKKRTHLSRNNVSHCE